MATADDFIKQFDNLKSTGGQGGGPMTADDFIQLLGGSKPTPKYDGSLLGGFMHSAGQGATANFSDEIAGAVGLDKEAYRERLDAFEREHPWLDMGGKALGAIGSTVGLMFTPGGQPAAAARAAGFGAKGWNALRGAFGANNAAKAIPGVDATVNMATRIPGLNRAANVVAGTNARRGGLAAAQYGITSRAGDYEHEYDETKGIVPNALDSVGGSISEGWDPAKIAMDYGAGGVLTKGLNRLFGGAANISDIVERAGTRSGSRILADASKHDGLGTDDLTAIREMVFPTGNTVPRDVAEDAFRAYGQALESGASQADADNAARAVLQSWDATRVNPRTGQPYAPGNAASRVRSYFRDTIGEHRNRSPIDMQLHELLKMETDGASGRALHDLVQKGVSSQDLGTGASELYGHATSRQGELGARARELLDYYLGGSGEDAVAMVQNLTRQIENNERIANSLYGPLKDSAKTNPEVGQHLRAAIERVRDRLAAEHSGETDDFARAISNNLSKFLHPEEEVVMGSIDLPKLAYPSRSIKDADGNVIERVQGAPVQVTQELADGTRLPMTTRSDPVTQTVQRGTPNMANFIGNRSNLGREIEKLKGSRDPTHAGLSKLKRYLDDEVFGLADPNAAEGTAGNVFHQFREINQQRLDAGKLRTAFQRGMDLKSQATGGKSLQALAKTMQDAERMNPEQRHMFVSGILANLKSKLEVKGDFHDVAAVFRNERMRKFMREYMGEEQADWFMREVQQIATATRTYNMRTGSPTGRINDHSAIERSLQNVRAVLNLMNIPGLLSSAADYVGDAATRGIRNSAMEVAGTPTSRPAALLQHLDELGTNMREPALGARGRVIQQAGPFSAIPATQGLTEDYKTGDF
jgi:hypothetical protein